MRVVCVDADVLLHCDSLENLPWEQLLPGQDICVVILPSVAREIDRLKLNGPAHIQTKARRAAQLFRKILSAHATTVTLRPEHPKLEVEVAAAVGSGVFSDTEAAGNAGRQMHDRIVSETLALGRTIGALLLTNDTLTAMSAREAGVQAELIPEAWMPAPESGAAEQVVQKLYDEMRRTAAVKPKLSLAFEDRSGKRLTGPLQLAVALVPALSAAEVERCMAAVTAAHPYSPYQKALSQTQRLRSVYGEVGRTYDKLYADYIADCKRVLGNLSELVALTECKGTFSLLINNAGGVAVKGLAVDVSIAPGQWLLGHSAFLNSAIELPDCPAAGQDEIKFPHAGIEPSHFDGPLAGDASPFRWNSAFAANNHREAKAVCEAFHPGDSRRFALVVELAKLGATAGKIQVVATAKNLEEPIAAELPIQVVTREMTRERAIANGLIRGELAQILKQTVALT